MRKLFLITLSLLIASGGISAGDMDKPYEKLRNHKAEAIQLDTGYKFQVGRKSSRQQAYFDVIALCDNSIDESLISKTGSLYNAMRSPEWEQKKCVLSRIDKDYPLYTDLNDYLTWNDRKKLFLTQMVDHAVDCMWKDNDGKMSPYACAQQRDFNLVVKFRLTETDRKLIMSEAEEIYEEESKEVIFNVLFDRCSEFGWESTEDISACIKQEAYRELQAQQQLYEMRLLEERLIEATTPRQKPFFFVLLDFYAQQEQTKRIRQMQSDIKGLKRSMRKARSASLYRQLSRMNRGN